MTMLANRVAIVTGAGAGLGRSHALAVAKAGARVVVNDMTDAADVVAAEIERAGGEAIAVRCSVTDEAAVKHMVETAVDRWGRIDILVNNAGILRDRSFGKLSLEDFRSVLEVHVMGSVICTQAAWHHMRAANYGRIVLTTSSSGLYGNFGQANYSAAKMALVGLMQTLAIEGRRHDIRVNCLAPSAATGMTDGLYDTDMLNRLGSERVSPAVVALASENAPTRAILLAGAGSFSAAHVTMTPGIFVDHHNAAAEILARFAEVSAQDGQTVPEDGTEQHRTEVFRAMARLQSDDAQFGT